MRMAAWWAAKLTPIKSSLAGLPFGHCAQSVPRPFALAVGPDCSPNHLQSRMLLLHRRLHILLPHHLHYRLEVAGGQRRRIDSALRQGKARIDSFDRTNHALGHESLSINADNATRRRRLPANVTRDKTGLLRKQKDRRR